MALTTMRASVCATTARLPARRFGAAATRATSCATPAYVVVSWLFSCGRTACCSVLKVETNNLCAHTHTGPLHADPRQSTASTPAAAAVRDHPAEADGAAEGHGWGPVRKPQLRRHKDYAVAARPSGPCPMQLVRPVPQGAFGFALVCFITVDTLAPACSSLPSCE